MDHEFKLMSFLLRVHLDHVLIKKNVCECSFSLNFLHRSFILPLQTWQ